MERPNNGPRCYFRMSRPGRFGLRLSLPIFAACNLFLYIVMTRIADGVTDSAR